MTIAVGWASGESEISVDVEDVAELLLGFGGISGPVGRDLANQVLRVLDRDVAYQIAESALATQQPIGLPMSPLSVVRHEDRFVGRYTGDGSFRYYSSPNYYDSSSPGGWPSLSESGGTVVGALIDEDELVWWNCSSTNSVDCAVAPIQGVTITNGTTNATKGYIDFCKDDQGSYYRVNLANELQTASSLGGVWSTISTGISRVCVFQGAALAVRASVGGGSIGFRVFRGGSLIYTSPSISSPLSSVNTVVVGVVNGRVVVGGAHSTAFELGIFRSALNDYETFEYVGSYRGVSSNVRWNTMSSFGSVAMISPAGTSALLSVDSGATWRPWGSGGRIESGRLFTATGVSLSV